MALNPQAAYVGSSAFAHKAGLHVSAIAKRPDAYEHVAARLGRQRHPLRRVGAGGQEHAHPEGEGARAHARRSAAQRPHRHAQADGARRLPLRGRRRVARAADAPGRRLGAELVRGRVVPGDHRRRRSARSAPGGVTTEATIKVHVDGDARDRHRRGQRSGQRARHRAALARWATATRRSRTVHLTDYKVRVLDTAKGTGAVTRVLVDSTNGERTWTTIGVSENIIEASWQALYDSLVYGLLLEPRRRGVALHHAHRSRSSPPSSTTSPVRSPTWRPGVHLPAAARLAGRPARRPRRRPAHRHPARAPGPNVGYAVTLAGRLRDKVTVAPHEHTADALAVIAELGMKRAASYGRAPDHGRRRDRVVAARLPGRRRRRVRAVAHRGGARRRPRVRRAAGRSSTRSPTRCCGCRRRCRR